MSTIIEHKHAVNLRNLRSTVELSQYGNHRPAIILNDADTGERNAVASVNLVDADLPPGHVHIKTWSENEGLITDLQDAGIIGPAKQWVVSGFVKAALCKLLITG